MKLEFEKRLKHMGHITKKIKYIKEKFSVVHTSGIETSRRGKLQ